MSMYFDKDGSPITSDQWIEKFNEPYKRIALDDVSGGKYRVSTVWLGLDHGFGGKPLIFETMVFDKESGAADLDMERYSTLEEAQAGHARMVEKWSQPQAEVTP